MRMWSIASIVFGLLGWLVAAGTCGWPQFCAGWISQAVASLQGLSGERAAFVVLDVLILAAGVALLGLLCGVVALVVERPRTRALWGFAMNVGVVLYHTSWFVKSAIDAANR